MLVVMKDDLLAVMLVVMTAGLMVVMKDDLLAVMLVD